MATATMATAVGAAALLYYALKRRVISETGAEMSQDGETSLSTVTSTVRLGLSRHAPSTWFEAIATLSETLRFTYSETLGKWPIADLAFGINFLMKRQGHMPAVSIYAGEGSHELKGSDILTELKELIHMITLCIHFSKKPFPEFLIAAGYSRECVLLQEPKAGLLKPAFTILVDDKLQSILLLIRGTHSVKDTLTAVTGAVVPFHHTVLDEDGVNNIVLGYAHCGMVAAARWIAQLATPVLLQAQKDYPMYKLKIVGHSLGGGTAALLTYILREKRDFSFVNCICFAPAACMTWELAESGKPFTISVVNGSDIVPTFSAASMDDLRAEVTASAWINDLREQIERVKFLKTVMRSTSALSNRISSISRPLYPYLEDAAKAGVATWKPVSSGTQVVMRRAQNVVKAVVKTRPSLGLASWSCMGARRRGISRSSLDSEGEMLVKTEDDAMENRQLNSSIEWSSTCSTKTLYHVDQSLDSEAENSHEEQSDIVDEVTEEKNDNLTELSEEFLLQHLEYELERQREASMDERKEEEEVARKLTREEEEEVAAKTAEVGNNRIVTDSRAQGRELNRFFPPGQIFHLLTVDADANVEESNYTSTVDGEPSRVALFMTDRALYGKVHLSRTMINDHFMPNYRRMMERLVKDMERTE